MNENKQYILIPFEEGNLIFKDDGREFFNSVDCLKDNEIVDLLNEQETKLKRIEKEVDCNVYHDDLKDIVLEIRCILNGDVE